jgi:dihydrolipoamide dehydrogenase
VPVYDRRTARSATAPVFIAGDAGEDRPLLHEAADEGRIAGDNAGRWPDVRVRPRRAPLAVVFSEPQIALAGATRRAAAIGRRLRDRRGVLRRPGPQPRDGPQPGCLRVYGEARHRPLPGRRDDGPGGRAHRPPAGLVAQRGDTVQQMLDSPFYHPVVEEGLRTALREGRPARHRRPQLQRALRMGPVPVERCLDCGPGA